jgi:23S rRNA (cytosine1962-C5)-methyltransferase
MNHPEVILNREGLKKYLAGSLWFSKKEIHNFKAMKSKIEAGSLVKVFSQERFFLGVGYFNPAVFFSLKLLAKEDVEITEEFFKNRFLKALKLRKELFPGEKAFRLVFGEGDFLPGLIIDIFDKVGVVQIYTLGMEKLKKLVIQALEEVLPLSAIILKNTMEKRKEEGLENYVEIVKGRVNEPILVEIDSIKFLIPVLTGQKTGFFFDQRENRKVVAKISKEKEVVDCFCYLGAFSFYALKTGAKRATLVDTSEKALSLAEEIAKLNHWKQKILILKTDVFQFLKNMKETEVIVLDPPAFIKSHKDIKKGEKKYESLFSMGIVKAKEYCFVSSCSHFLTRENFFDMVMRCLRKSGKEGIILHQGFQAGDHPVNPFVKETLYLKSFLLKF